MNETRRRLLLLYDACLISRKNIRKLLEVNSALNEIKFYTPSDFISRCNFSKSSAQKLHDWLQMNPFENFPDIENTSINQITIFDPLYPSSLRAIPDPPLVLYVKGNPHLLSCTPSLSVVGTRKPSTEAKEKMKRVLSPLINKDWIIVSGMARGIDSYAHCLTLQQNGSTIAVLGGGFSHIYPPENRLLFNHLAEKQLVITEYPAHLPPQRFHFPERNRIISGLGFGTLVVEAEERSGSLITADQALEQGKDVFAIPGSPLIPQSRGVNKLIQQGAKLIMQSSDIEEEWRI